MWRAFGQGAVASSLSKLHGGSLYMSKAVPENTKEGFRKWVRNQGGARSGRSAGTSVVPLLRGGAGPVAVTA